MGCACGIAIWNAASRMSHISRPRSTTGSVKNDSAGESTMPSGIRKTRSKAKLAKPVSSTASVATSSSKESHQYLNDGDKVKIDRWNDTVPKKSTRPHGVPEEADPVIQAYLEAKMNLFRSAGVPSSQSSVGRDDQSVCSSQSRQSRESRESR